MMSQAADERTTNDDKQLISSLRKDSDEERDVCSIGSMRAGPGLGTCGRRAATPAMTLDDECYVAVSKSNF